ncbi:ROK family protein [Photobacterium galatheae]|uniref:ROK family transcriptional regulator n=1 Tax=Photobacterium galatheae TaxID=1654360 RepID=A0A066RST0_9GAMM|nr:ROK family protein [Photobacterium galatheae]KDM90722.1 ROK family transcriptional regulator [Photobacterium galatheae]MCM0149948.1 ROK family protein [Photobacterium galatheae]
MDKYYWGIDLGGTKVECAVISREDDRCVLRERIPSHAERGYAHILNRIQFLVARCAETLGCYPSEIGFGTPGALDPVTGLMKNCNSTALNGQPLHRDLADLLKVRVRLANDANCLALAETHLGVVRQVNPNAEVVFAIIMGTGVGAGIVVNGKVIHGLHGIAGEWGHNVIEPAGRECYCGKRGCLETVISGQGLEIAYHQRTGVQRSLSEIMQLSQHGEADAMLIQDRLMRYFGLAVAQIINVLDPDVIVVGGGVGNIDLLYDTGRQAIMPHLFNPVLNTAIVKPILGDSAGVFGAAMLVK